MTNGMRAQRIGHFILPLVGLALAACAWAAASAAVPDLPSPQKT